MNRVKYTEWIDDYVEGALDQASKEEFESALSSNKSLSFEYKFGKDIDRILGDDELLDFSEKCLAASNEMKLPAQKLAKVVHFTRRYWYAAASLVVIALIISGIVLFNPGSYSGEKLFRMYYKSGDAVGISRSGNISMAEALLAFSKSEYVSADQLFDQILANEPDNFAVRYYAGISNIELKNFPKAIKMFEFILDDPNNLYSEFAEWYLGLSLLASEQADEATSVFTNIASSRGHLYQKEASSILDKLGKGEKNKKFINNLFFLILPF